MYGTIHHCGKCDG